MGKIEYAQILLNKPIYYSGEITSCTFKFRVRENTKCNSVDIFLRGYANCYWTETETRSGTDSNGNSTSETYTESYRSNEVYLNSTTILLAKKQNADLMLVAGDYSLPFELQLPSNLPASLRAHYGDITYEIIAKIDIPWTLFDKKTMISFDVKNQVNLNALANLKLPYGLSETKIFGCCCCESEPLTVNFSLPKTGYLAGEIIHFRVITDNKSEREIQMTVYLIQDFDFYAEGRSKCIRDDLNLVSYYKSIQPNSIDTWNGMITIPNSARASSLNTCSIIKTTHFVNLKFNSGDGLAKSKYIRIPIVIGTIQFDNNVNEKY